MTAPSEPEILRRLRRDFPDEYAQVAEGELTPFAALAAPPEPVKPRAPTCLRVLGLDGDATATDVRRAYRRLAKRTHPDAGGDPKHFRELTAHYEHALRLVPAA